MDNLVIIIIPIYREKFTSFEEISLRRVLKVLGKKYPISFICPENLSLKEYHKITQSNTLLNLSHKRFPASYFESIQSYNRLMLSSNFYKEFLKYEYMLIYQLDCYIFKDDLEYWCHQKYDYIGAPWFTYTLYNLSKFEKLKFFTEQYLDKILKKDISEKSLYYQVGNGGFSLRKINKFYKILEKYSSKVINKYIGNDSTSLYNEDVFWSYEVNKGIVNKIKIPFFKKAAHFSLDPCPSIGMKIINTDLPFGCHAWHKNLLFWKNYIKEI